MNNLSISLHLDGDIPEQILDMKLKELYCKHVMRSLPVNGILLPRAEKLLEESKKLGYDVCEWGLHSGHPNDLQYHSDKIIKMIDDGYNHAIRIVICKYDFQEEPVFWVDNLHSAIKYILQYGESVALREIPFYIVNIEDYDNPSIYGWNGSVRENYEDILGAVSCGYKRFRRSNSKELIDVGYKLKHFMADNAALLYEPVRHLGFKIEQRRLW